MIFQGDLIEVWQKLSARTVVRGDICTRNDKHRAWGCRIRSVRHNDLIKTRELHRLIWSISPWKSMMEIESYWWNKLFSSVKHQRSNRQSGVNRSQEAATRRLLTLNRIFLQQLSIEMGNRGSRGTRGARGGRAPEMELATAFITQYVPTFSPANQPAYPPPRPRQYPARRLRPVIYLAVPYCRW